MKLYRINIVPIGGTPELFNSVIIPAWDLNEAVQTIRKLHFPGHDSGSLPLVRYQILGVCDTAPNWSRERISTWPKETLENAWLALGGKADPRRARDEHRIHGKLRAIGMLVFGLSLCFFLLCWLKVPAGPQESYLIPGAVLFMVGQGLLILGDPSTRLKYHKP